ncbi:putative reverse transcriptase domain-containing protein [Tanacetum coccineum]
MWVDNKKAKMGNGFVATSLCKNGYKGNLPKCAKCDGHHQESMPCHACFKCNQTGHVAKNCRVVAVRATPVNAVNPSACYKCRSPDHFRNTCPRLNREPGQVYNNPNQVLSIGGNNPHRGNNGNLARGRAFVMGVNEADQDPNVVMGTFSLNNHFATILFDSSVDDSFVSTTFLPLLDMKPNNLNFSYVIELENGGKEETNKIICGCTLVLEGIPFSIDLLPIGLGSFERGNMIAYASRQLKVYEKYYTTHDLELGAVVFALKIWRHYLYRTKSIIYTDHRSLQHIFDQKELNMHQNRWIRLFSDYDCEIRYHPGIRTKILEAQREASKDFNTLAEILRGLNKQFERRDDDYKMEKLSKIYINEIVARYDVLVSIISDRDSRFTSRFCWDTHLPLVEFSYKNSYHSSIKCVPFEALYGRKCRSPVIWVEVGESQLNGPEIVHVTTDKIFQIKQRLKTIRDRQKS